MIFQFIGEIGILGRFMLRSPGKIIIFLPFGLESLAVSATHPELRFFQIDRSNAGINHPLYLCFLHITDKTFGRHNVGYQVSVGYLVSVTIPLPLFQVTVYSIPFAEKIVFIVSPCHSGHKLCLIPLVSPRLNTLFKRNTLFIQRAIHHRGISTHIRFGFPGFGCLKSCFCFLVFGRLSLSKRSIIAG